MLFRSAAEMCVGDSKFIMSLVEMYEGLTRSRPGFAVLVGGINRPESNVEEHIKCVHGRLAPELADAYDIQFKVGTRDIYFRFEGRFDATQRKDSI